MSTSPSFVAWCREVPGAALTVSGGIWTAHVVEPDKRLKRLTTTAYDLGRSDSGGPDPVRLADLSRYLCGAQEPKRLEVPKPGRTAKQAEKEARDTPQASLFPGEPKRVTGPFAWVRQWLDLDKIPDKVQLAPGWSWEPYRQGSPPSWVWRRLVGEVAFVVWPVALHRDPLFTCVGVGTQGIVKQARHAPTPLTAFAACQGESPDKERRQRPSGDIQAHPWQSATTWGKSTSDLVTAPTRWKWLKEKNGPWFLSQSWNVADDLIAATVMITPVEEDPSQVVIKARCSRFTSGKEYECGEWSRRAHSPAELRAQLGFVARAIVGDVNKAIAASPSPKRTARTPPSKMAAPSTTKPTIPLAAACPEGDAACSLSVIGGTCSIPSPFYVVDSTGPKEQPARFCVMDATNLEPSHLASNGFRANRAYPRDVQERRYDTDVAEQVKVTRIAQTLRPDIVFSRAPDAINGPPVVTSRGIVLGGNGRTMALQLMYSTDPGRSSVVKEWLETHASEYGLTPEAVRQYPHPVIVRVVDTPNESPPALAKLVRAYNQSMTQSLDVRAEATSEARQLEPSDLDVLSSSISDDDTLSTFLTSRASLPFLERLRSRGIITDRNASLLLQSDGLLSEEGRTLVSRLLTAIVITEADLLDALGPETRATLARSVPSILRTAGAAEGWYPVDALRAAARDLVKLRAQREHGVASVEEYLAQQDAVATMMGEKAHAVDAVALGPEVLQVLASLSSSPLKWSRVWSAYAADATHTQRGQGELALDEATPLTPRESLIKHAQEQGVTFTTSPV